MGIESKKGKEGCRHGSVDSSAPIILGSIPKHAINAFIIYIVKFVLYLSCEKNGNKQKEAEFGPFFKIMKGCKLAIRRHRPRRYCCCFLLLLPPPWLLDNLDSGNFHISVFSSSGSGHSSSLCHKTVFGRNLDFPKIKKLNKFCSNA